MAGNSSQADSLLDAACQGASQGIEIVLGVIANVICFVAFVAFINGVLGWLGLLVGFDNWSVEELLSYVFMPLSFLMGIPWEEARAVGKLIGIKTVINEFNAYKVLGDMIRAGELSVSTWRQVWDPGVTRRFLAGEEPGHRHVRDLRLFQPRLGRDYDFHDVGADSRQAAGNNELGAEVLRDRGDRVLHDGVHRRDFI